VALSQGEHGKAGVGLLKGLSGTYGHSRSLAERGLPDNGRRLPKHPKEGQSVGGYVMQYPLSKQLKPRPGESNQAYGERLDRLEQKYFRVGEAPQNAAGYHGGWRGDRVKREHVLPCSATYHHGKWDFTSLAD
jgi:hypothetical protein